MLKKEELVILVFFLFPTISNAESLNATLSCSKNEKDKINIIINWKMIDEGPFSDKPISILVNGASGGLSAIDGDKNLNGSDVFGDMIYSPDLKLFSAFVANQKGSTILVSGQNLKVSLKKTSYYFENAHALITSNKKHARYHIEDLNCDLEFRIPE